MKTETIALLIGTGVISFILSYLGAAVGLILGHLRLPLLVYILNNPIAGASTNLAVSGLGAVAGSIKHVRDGRVSWKVLLLMGLPSVVGAVVAVRLFTSINLIWSHLVIGGMLLFSGIGLLRKRKEEPKGEPGELLSRQWMLIGEVVIGVGIGALAAVTGLMLGSMRLPMMIRWLRIDPKEAVGSNMLIGCLTAFAAAGAAWHAGHEQGKVVLDWTALLFVAPPTILGSYFGAKWTGKISPQKLKGWVGGVVAFTGLFMLGQAANHWARHPDHQPHHPPRHDAFLDEDVWDWDEDEDEEPHPGPQPQPHLEPQDTGESQ